MLRSCNVAQTDHGLLGIFIYLIFTELEVPYNIIHVIVTVTHKLVVCIQAVPDKIKV